jgi:hypothetical protein
MHRRSYSLSAVIPAQAGTHLDPSLAFKKQHRFPLARERRVTNAINP